MVSQQFLIVDSTTLANFVNWGQAVSNFIKSAWTQTADTGQINWATVALPAAGAFGGYEIYKPNDALTPTFFLKVQYGRTSGTSTAIMQLTLSTGTDGAGNPTGITTAVNGTGTQNTLNQSHGVTPWECDFSASGSRLCILMARNTTSTSGNGAAFGFIVERSLNTSGAYTSQYVTILIFGQTGNNNGVIGQSTLLLPASTVFNVNGGALGIPVTIFDVSTSCALGGNIAVSPVFPSYGQFGNPMTGAGSARANDVVDGQQYTSSLYGTTMNFMASKSNGSTGNFGGNNASALLMRYE